MPERRLRLLVGAKLRLLRARAGLTLAEVARRMGSHRPIVGRLESGLHDPSLETIGRYCAALGVDPRVVLAEVDLALGFRPCGGVEIAQQPRGGDAHGAGGESPHPVTGAAERAGIVSRVPPRSPCRSVCVVQRLIQLAGGYLEAAGDRDPTILRGIDLAEVVLEELARERNGGQSTRPCTMKASAWNYWPQILEDHGRLG